MLFHHYHLLLPIILLTAIVFLAFHIISFIHLFFEHAGLSINQDEILEAFIKDTHATEAANRIQQIPKIIHQVFHNWADPGNDTLPTDWTVVSGTCKALNEGWEYMLWTESTSRQFIKDEYPWMLSTYDGYRFPVQRVDAVRYFLLFHYGGIYLDLDNGCLQNLSPLLYYPLWTTDGGRGALSNNILGSTPGHLFYKLLTKSLITYNYNYIFPYITISYASGQWFETSIWEKYHALLPKTGVSDVLKGYRVMMDDRPGSDPWIFFTQERGGSWVNWDNRFWLWVGDHLVFLGGLGLVCFGGITYRCLKSVRRRRGDARKGNRGFFGKRTGEVKGLDDVSCLGTI
ncbi:hypothetical protein IFR05_015574 [Cadophora sp. M221]|nr:hypothetical protein IFR05_015574 [Cadophora sp. M221]